MKWDEFTHYKLEMFRQTGTKMSPWVVMNGNEKDKARKEAMSYVLNNTPYEGKGYTSERLEPDPEIFSIEENEDPE